MGVFDKVKGIFSRKKVETPPIKREPLEPLPLTKPENTTPPKRLPIPREPLQKTRPIKQLTPPKPIEPLAPRPIPNAQRIDENNMRAKIDLLLTQMDNIITQNRMMDERLKKIEKSLTGTRGIRYY
jgi:hypothetical protein